MVYSHTCPFFAFEPHLCAGWKFRMRMRNTQREKQQMFRLIFPWFYFFKTFRSNGPNYFPINNIGVTLIVANKNRILVHHINFVFKACSWAESRLSARTIHVDYIYIFLRLLRLLNTPYTHFFSICLFFFSPSCVYFFSRILSKAK